MLTDCNVINLGSQALKFLSNLDVFAKSEVQITGAATLLLYLLIRFKRLKTVQVNTLSMIYLAILVY